LRDGRLGSEGIANRSAFTMPAAIKTSFYEFLSPSLYSLLSEAAEKESNVD
jgi:hypothetical protein